MNIDGTVSAGFEGVAEAFERNFIEHGEVGAAVCVYLGGEPVVDLRGGHFDAAQTKPYDENALQLIFSSTKGASAMCVHHLVSEQRLDLDAPVTDYWPEFGACGKSKIPVRWLLTHKSGLVDVDRTLTPEQGLEWDTVVSAIEGSTPLWEPGSKHGYHAVTFAWLVGEVVRRVSGMTLGEYFHRTFAAPLGLEFWIGLPAEHHHRVSPIIPFEPPAAFIEQGLHDSSTIDTDGGGLTAALNAIFGPGNMIVRALTAPGGAFAQQNRWNDPAVWSAELPSANGIANARSVARLYASCVSEVDGVRLLDTHTIRSATQRQTEGSDAVLMIDIPFGTGFMLDGPFSKFGSPNAFGHYGFGGSVGFADAEREVAFGYVMNKSDLGIAGDPRTSGLIDALNLALP